MFTGNLKGNDEHIFRQSILGSVGHIVTNYDRFMYWLRENEEDGFRINTLCGKDYKYNANYSSMDGRNGVVRNACEYCFTEYEPDERREERAKEQRRKVHQTDLPF